MSVEINHSLSSKEIQQLLVHVFSPYLKGTTTNTIHPYFCGNNYARIPFAHALKQGYKLPVHGYGIAKYKFKGTLRPEQVAIISQAFQLLARNSYLLLATHVGFGKTILAIYILSQLGLKTCIVTANRKVLCPQWFESLYSFLDNPRVCLLGANDRVDYTSYDIFIINALNVPKLRDRLDFIGMLIVDEIHLVLSHKMCESLLSFTPKYFVALSATPYRTDGSNKLFELFLENSVIFKPLLRPHVVYKVETGIIPESASNAHGKLDWDKVLNAQAENPRRNQLIVSLVQKYPYKFIILCKRVVQIQLLEDLLNRAHISTYAVYGSRKVDRTELTNHQVVVGTFSKLGVGFDDKSSTALLLAADVEEYFIQYLGRVFRNPKVEPVIFDLVDNHYVLKKHYTAREKVYRESGMNQLIFESI